MRILLFAMVACCIGITANAQDAATTQPKPAQGKEQPEGGRLPASARWLLGEWTFDAEYTEKKQSEGGKEGELAKALINPQLIAQLKGAKLKTTDNDVIFTTESGNGKAEKYTFLDSPDENTVSLKEGDGKVTAYHREGEYVWINSTGTAPSPFYFRRSK